MNRVLSIVLALMLLPSFSRAQDFQQFKIAQADSKKLRLEDLGFDKTAAAVDQKEAAILTKRSKQLKAHQVMGLATLALMTATLFTGPEHAPADDLHKSLGIATAASYATTAYLSLSAPEPKKEEHKGLGMKIHRSLLYVHLPGMILTPIAGLIANEQARKGEKLHGIAKYKKDLAYVTYGAFAAAAISVTLDF